jgi:hypothetical protein
MRTLTRLVITTYGGDFATASCEYRRKGNRSFRPPDDPDARPRGWRKRRRTTLFDDSAAEYRLSHAEDDRQAPARCHPNAIGW